MIFYSGLEGAFDNFQQYWQENTEDDIHGISVDKMHEHIHVRFWADRRESNVINVTFFSGRNNAVERGSSRLEFLKVGGKDFLKVNDAVRPLIITDTGFKTEDSFLSLDGDTVRTNGMGVYELNEPYVALRCRYFSGWFRFPEPTDPDEIYFLGDLRIHDQGGMAELDRSEANYTVELTQLVYGRTLKIMKIAIYEEKMKDVEINSKAISYSWVNVDAKRLGINLRKIISGWTLIEEGHVSSNNTDFKKEG